MCFEICTDEHKVLIGCTIYAKIDSQDCGEGNDSVNTDQLSWQTLLSKMTIHLATLPTIETT